VLLRQPTTGLTLYCAHGHVVAPAPLSCMRAAGWYWCGHCILDPEKLSMASSPIRGAYYPPSQVHSLCCDCGFWTPPEGDCTSPGGHNVCGECAMACPMEVQRPLTEGS
jgi:hypothetical protein